MTKGKWSSRLLLLVLLVFFCLPAAAQAEVVTGQAVIENGDSSTARENARKDAMRTFVENKVGVHIESSTESVNNMLVRDTVLANSDGYVQINRTVKEWQSGDIYFIEMDLSADMQKIQTAAKDLKSRLEAMSDNASRQGIQVAVIGRDAAGRLKPPDELNKYIQAKMENVGFQAFANDDVLAYMETHADDPQFEVEARRIARVKRQEGNAILRGTLSTVSVRHSESGLCEAAVKASFELVGLDSNEVNTFSKYFTAVAETEGRAEERADDLALQEAAETLGQKALLTVQGEFRGGVHHIKTMARFAGISDLAGQRPLIMSGIAASSCHVIRTSLTSGGVFQVFLSSDSYNTPEEIREAILQHISGLQQAADNEAELGSAKLDFTF